MVVDHRINREMLVESLPERVGKWHVDMEHERIAQHQ